MLKNEKEKLQNAWLKSANKDLKVSEDLFEGKHYNYCLFFCQLTLEKLLKALFVKNKKRYPPITHDLTRLAKKASLKLNQEKLDLLAEITTFNVEARYDIFKEKLYKKATKDFTKKYLKITKEFYKYFKNLI